MRNDFIDAAGGGDSSATPESPVQAVQVIPVALAEAQKGCNSTDKAAVEATVRLMNTNPGLLRQQLNEVAERGKLPELVLMAALATFLSILFEPEDLIELRPRVFMGTVTAKARAENHPLAGQHYIDRVFEPCQQQWVQQKDAIEAILNLPLGCHAFFGVNHRSSDWGKNKYVTLARCIFVNLNDVESIEVARAMLSRAGLPEPSMLVSTGGGYHGYYRLTELVEDPVKWSNAMQQVMDAFEDKAKAKGKAKRNRDGKAVKNLARFLRLPGFINPKLGVEKVVEIVSASGERFDLAVLLKRLVKPTALARKTVVSSPKAALQLSRIPSDGDVKAALMKLDSSRADEHDELVAIGHVLKANGPQMCDPVQRVIEALRACGCNPKQSGTGWSARCPAHADKAPSLSVGTGDDGRALVYCHAGCELSAICDALELQQANLFADSSDPTHRASSKAAPQEQPQAKSTIYPTAGEAIAQLENQLGTRSEFWTYHDRDSNPVGVVVRWDKPDGSKDIRPVSLSSDGSGWIIGGMSLLRPLYGLPELLAAPAETRVYVCEGEKAADAARYMGLLATTSSHGAQSAGKTDWSPLKDRVVVILPDHDGAGERYAADVAQLCMKAGAKSVQTLRLAERWRDMPKGGDFADIIAICSADMIQSICTEVQTFIEKTDADTAKPEQPLVIAAFMPFPVEVLPEPIRGSVLADAKAIGCDASYIALPLLSALASAIGNTRVIQLKQGWREPAIVWTAIVGESGTHKTPAFKAAMKAIRKAQSKAFKEHEVALAKWETERLQYEAALTGWKRDAVKKPGGGSLPVDPPGKPTPPIVRRYIVNDTTTEALAPILLGNPRGVLLARDELAGWLGSFDRYAKAGKGGADSAHWLSMHNGEALTIDRKTGIPPTIHVPSASVSIAGGIQPGILKRALGQEHHESGLLARLLFAMPPRRVKCWTDADMDPATEAAVAAVFDSLFTLMPVTNADGDEWPRVVMLADDGKAAWVRFYNEHAKEQANLSGDEAAAWSKLEGYAARFALIFHLIRCVTSDSTLLDKTRVDEASIAAGVVLARWFGNEARRVYAILGESDDDRESRRLVEWIEQCKGGSVTARDLTRGPREYRSDPERAAKALDELVAAGVGRWEAGDHGPKGGRPVDRFRLLSRHGDTGDGDETTVNIGDRVGSVTVATPTDTSDDQEKT